MKHITFYLDFVSPGACLAFEGLPLALIGHSYSVTYQPVQSATLSLPGGPAFAHDEILLPLLDLAHRQGMALQRPARYPFDPQFLLQLALACDANGQPNRYVCETLFRHVWQGGADANDASRLQALTQQLAPRRVPGADEARVQLERQTAQAIALGVTAVPTLALDGRLFAGAEALPQLRAHVQGEAGGTGI